MNQEPPRIDRGRRFVATNFFVVIVALLFLAAIGGGLIYLTYVDLESEYEERTVGTATTTSEYQYRATVQEQNPIFPVGTELTDRTHFFTTATPTLEGEYTFTYATDDGNLNATTELVLILENTADNEVVWSDEDHLATAAGVDGQTATSFSINMTSLNSRLEAIERDLGTQARHVDIAVVARTTLSGELAGQQASETFVEETTIVPQEETYRVVSGREADSEMVITESRAIRTSPGLLQGIGPILLFVSSTGAIAGLAIAKRRGQLEVHARSAQSLGFKRHRRVYDDWISQGSIASQPHKHRVKIETLEDIVDVAIDGDSRVIEDSKNSEYYVLTDNVVYVFTAPDVGNEQE